ncbi:MAG: helicase [Micavibrio sp.]|nr:helicase [Micavibrio sp.]|tara:strand:- start:561 stop:3539 length:2979 start_codon:yes stop_codon:yes gene_type:complete
MGLPHKYSRDHGRVFALLGPTNTGKTYRAIDRMLSYESGMIGFPLRLLARENYDKVAAIKGRSRVALVTGEEKIIPPNAKYYCCTVESMPVEKAFEFIGLDEVQLAEDPDRGHIFTDRILRARGLEETMLMGSDTMRTVLSRLIPGIEFEEASRFSRLTYTGFKKLTRLPKRSAIVAFSMDEVYNTAELIRRQRGGTAVVLGALSPRTRNAQVEMYQSGEVDFMVATDAIGMGLNMDIHHVALAATRKFDGHRLRGLRNIEVGQIAGRAGRYMKDGTFGVTGRVHDLDPDVVKAIENHDFNSVREICWRNADLEFNSPKLLLKSLEQTSGDKMLVRGRPSDDYLALKAMMRRDDVIVRADNPEMVRLLWEVCQVPDFRQTLSDAHQDLIAEIYTRVSDGPLPEDWVAARIRRLDDRTGDVDALMARIAHIRTWTFISHKYHWLERAEYWQGQARAIEDGLSDALHQALIKRFVDSRTSMLMKSLEEGQELMAGIRANGEVIVESHLIGHLHAFRFIPDKDAVGADYKVVMATARKALTKEVKRRLAMILNAKPEQITLDESGKLLWQQKVGSPLPGEPVAALKKGDSALKPGVELIDSDLLDGSDKEAVLTFLKEWLDQHIKTVLEPLVNLENQDGIEGAARGITYQVYEAMGIIPREKLEDLIADLTAEDRAVLRARRIKLGPILVFLPALNKPAAVRLRGLLWALWHEKTLPVEVPKDGIVSTKVDEKSIDRNFYQSIGYPVYGGRAIRIDMLDRVISAVYDAADQGKFQAQHKMAEWLGCPIDDLYAVLTAMGHKKIYDPADEQKADDQISVNEGHNEDQSAEASDSSATGGKDAADQGENAKGADAKGADAANATGDVSGVALAPELTGDIKEAITEGADAHTEQGVTTTDAAPKVEAQKKPELATFRLKKGKANAQSKPFHKKPFAAKGGKKQGDDKKDRSKGKRERRGNPKGKSYKQSNMSAEAKTKDDSPFAVLEQLKKNADGKG